MPKPNWSDIESICRELGLHGGIVMRHSHIVMRHSHIVHARGRARGLRARRQDCASRCLSLPVDAFPKLCRKASDHISPRGPLPSPVHAVALENTTRTPSRPLRPVGARAAPAVACCRRAAGSSRARGYPSAENLGRLDPRPGPPVFRFYACCAATVLSWRTVP